MTTTKSYSDQSRFSAIYRASLKQQLPMGILSLIFFFLTIPLPYLVDQMYRPEPPNPMGVELFDLTSRWRDYFSSGVYLDRGQGFFALMLLMLMGLVAALMQTSYMHSRKMTDLYHSMPIRRPALLTANTLASLTAIFVPFAAMTLATMLVQLIMYGPHLVGYGWYFQFTALDLLGGLAALAGVYAFTVFIATWVGTVFDGFALTGVLGFTPLVLVTIVVMLWSSLTYGATSLWLDEVLLWLSPFTAPFLRFVYLGGFEGYMQDAALAAGGIRDALVLLAVWLVIAGVLYAAAIWNYNRRKSELCEQTLPQGVLQIIAKCFAAFCGAALFYVIFSDINNAFTMILTSLFGALLIGVVAELILSRGFRSLKRNLIWLAGSGLLFCLVVFGAQADPIGYVSRVPDAAAVDSVKINYHGRFEESSDHYALYRSMGAMTRVGVGLSSWYSYDSDTLLTDPEDVAIVTEMHRMTVENAPERRHGFSGYFDYGEEYDNGLQVSIEYKLKDGGTITRSYNPVYNEAYRVLSQLEAKEEFIRQNHALFRMDEMFGAEAADYLNTIAVFSDNFGKESEVYRPSAEKTNRVMEAVRQDMLAESFEELANPAGQAYGSLEFQFEVPDIYGDPNMVWCDVVLSAGYSRTVEVLRELGMWQDRPSPAVDEIRFCHANQIGLRTNQIFALRAGRVEDIEFWGHDRDEVPLPSVTDAADIAQTLAAARNQMMIASEDVYVAACYKDGDFLGGQMIRFEDLPQSAKDGIAELYGISEGTFAMEYGYPIYPERAMAAVRIGDTIPVAAVELSVS